MKNYKLLFLLLLVPGMMLLFSCTKNNNTTVTKTDSVYYSNWNVLNMVETDAGDTLFYEDFNNSAITLNIIDKGGILSYFAYINNTDTVLLPASDALTQYFDVGVIEVQSGFQFVTSDNYLYRYVLVPGTVSIGDATGGAPKTYTVDQLKQMSYKQVMSLLNNPASNASVHASTN